ncbi:hypothetical protein WJX75_001869 [Coccomyxa subellipsoidea]|uniref:GAF domain-containing protein n=1 Tax=Coccomyxa subellipsoidea TaxID=248742 RepID=A0ABR2YUT9_9CHLO
MIPSPTERLVAAPTSPFDAAPQAAGSRSRSMQQLNTRLDSALDYAGRGTQLRITRSELLLSALPTIASPGRSLQEPDARQSLAGSSRSGSLSAHRLQSVGEAATAPGTAAEAGPIGSPERLSRMDSCDLAFTTPPSSDPNPMVLATLCQSVQSLVQVQFVGVLLLEDDKMTSLLQFSFGCNPLKAPLDAGFIDCLVEPDMPDMIAIEDTLKHSRLESNAAVLDPPGLRFYAAVPLIVLSGLRLGFLYIADSMPQQLDKDLVPALKNFAKATTKRLVKMGVAGRILERRRDVLSVLKCKHEPQLVVDTATANWQVLHASAAAREIIEGLAEDPPLGGLWDMFAAAPENEEETPGARVPTGLGERIIRGEDFALRVRHRSKSAAADITLLLRPVPSEARDRGHHLKGLAPIIKGKRKGGLWTRVVRREAREDVGSCGWPEELARGCRPWLEPGRLSGGEL